MNILTRAEMLTQIRQNLKGTGIVVKEHNATINGSKVYYFENEFGRKIISNMLVNMAYEHSFNIKEIRL